MPSYAGTPPINKINALNFATSDIKLQIIRIEIRCTLKSTFYCDTRVTKKNENDILRYTQ